MNTQVDIPQRHGLLQLLAAMVVTRLELATCDIETHVRATLVSLALALVSLVLALIAFTFVGIATIVFFWDTHRDAAVAGVTLTYAAFAAIAASSARSRWKARPAALEGTMHELALDREAMRGRS